MTRVLVNHFYARPVGHAIEAIHYAHGHWNADRSREVDVLLAADTATELGDWAPWVRATHVVDHPLLERCDDSLARLAGVPREWDWIADDFRRHQAWQLELFPGMADFYAASDEWLTAREGRTIEGFGRLSYAQAPWRLALPDAARARAAAALGGAGRATGADPGDARRSGGPSAAGGPVAALMPGGPSRAGGPVVALMPGGSGPAEWYPSAASWARVLDALRAALGDGLRVVLVGRRAAGPRTATPVDAAGHAALLDHLPGTVDGFDLPLADQLALVERADVFLSPHTGFGMAAVAVGTPWLTLSGGRWFEFFFNGVPFRSILPGPAHRTGVFGQQGAEEPVVADRDGTRRRTSMIADRVDEDLDRLAAAAQELVAGTLTPERSLRDYYAELATIVPVEQIFSIDGVHAAYV